jgi:hypothetical protein
MDIWFVLADELAKHPAKAAAAPAPTSPNCGWKGNLFGVVDDEPGGPTPKPSTALS